MNKCAPIKLFACLSAVCGLTCYPYAFSSEKEIPKEKKRKAMTIGKFNDGGIGFSLKKLENIDRLLEGKVTRLNFKDLGMMWGKDKYEHLPYSLRLK